MQRSYKHFDWIMALFVTVLVISNILSSAKIVDFGANLLGIGLAVDAGTLLFPLSYIFGDILTEVYGYQRARKVIWVGFACLALSALAFRLVQEMPGEAAWQSYAGDAAYQSILGGMTSGGIVIASLLAYWLGSFSNAFVMARLKVITGGRWLWTRTISSTLVGELVDTLGFVLIATLFGVFPWEIFLALTLTNYLLKCATEVLMTPVTYAVVGFLKRAEGEDYFDRQTDFNPLAM